METINNNLQNGLLPSATRMPMYLVIPNLENGTMIVDGRTVIKRGTIVIYTIDN